MVRWISSTTIEISPDGTMSDWAIVYSISKCNYAKDYANCGAKRSRRAQMRGTVAAEHFTLFALPIGKSEAPPLVVNRLPPTSLRAQCFASLNTVATWREFSRASPFLEVYRPFPISTNGVSILSRRPWSFHPAITYPPVHQCSTSNSFGIHRGDGCKRILL